MKDFEVQIDDYTALVGANGTGKSYLLYALEWFYERPP
ncbi:MAG: AAA family ATPase [Candidatus Microthrix sp.]|nr:AAA family ATPase [Candidatus Microthrix sp.]